MLSITLVILILTVLVCSSNDYLLETRLQNSAQKNIATSKTIPGVYIKKKKHNLKVAQTVLRTAHREEDRTEGVTGVGVCLLAGCPAYVKY